MTMASVDERRADVRRLLTERMQHPLTAPGSERLARLALAQFSGVDHQSVLDRCVDKILETLGDGRRHDTLAVPPDRRVAVWFVVWPGTHDEALPLRLGSYLEQLAGKARWLVEAGIA